MVNVYRMIGKFSNNGSQITLASTLYQKEEISPIIKRKNSMFGYETEDEISASIREYISDIDFE